MVCGEFRWVMDAEQTKDSQAGLQNTMSMRNYPAADSAGTDHVTWL